MEPVPAVEVLRLVPVLTPDWERRTVPEALREPIVELPAEPGVP